MRWSKTPIKQVKKTERSVNPIRRGILLPIRSDNTPRRGMEKATRIMDKERAKPYKISSPPLSTVTHRGKYKEMMFMEKMVLAKS